MTLNESGRYDIGTLSPDIIDHTNHLLEEIGKHPMPLILDTAELFRPDLKERLGRYGVNLGTEAAFRSSILERNNSAVFGFARTALLTNTPQGKSSKKPEMRRRYFAEDFPFPRVSAIVCETADDLDAVLHGDLSIGNMQTLGLKGAVTDGAVRDEADINEAKFPLVSFAGRAQSHFTVDIKSVGESVEMRKREISHNDLLAINAIGFTNFGPFDLALLQLLSDIDKNIDRVRDERDAALSARQKEIKAMNIPNTEKGILLDEAWAEIYAGFETEKTTLDPTLISRFPLELKD